MLQDSTPPSGLERGGAKPPWPPPPTVYANAHNPTSFHYIWKNKKFEFWNLKANHQTNELISIVVVFKAALASTEAGIVNVLSASSCFFTLLLSAVFPSNSTDSPTLTKVSGYFLLQFSFSVFFFFCRGKNKNRSFFFSFLLPDHEEAFRIIELN